MAPIAGRPFLEILLEQLIHAGCQAVILSVGYLHEVILERFRDGYRGLSLDFVIEETPLGTGGAIRRALRHATESDVFVLNGDTYLDLHFSTMLSAHAASRDPFTMAVTHVADVGRYGGVSIKDEHIIGFIEKGQKGAGWINAGVYAMQREFPWPRDLPTKFSFELDVLAKSIDQLCPSVFRCKGQFLDIGTPEDLDRAQTELRIVKQN